MIDSKSLHVSLLSSFALVAVLAGCTGRPTAEEVVDRSTPVICSKMKECNGASFALSFPTGVDACVTKLKEEMSKKYGSDLNKSSTCTDDELDECMRDFEAASCPGKGELPPVPCDC